MLITVTQSACCWSLLVFRGDATSTTSSDSLLNGHQAWALFPLGRLTIYVDSSVWKPSPPKRGHVWVTQHLIRRACQSFTPGTAPVTGSCCRPRQNLQSRQCTALHSQAVGKKCLPIRRLSSRWSLTPLGKLAGRGPSSGFFGAMLPHTRAHICKDGIGSIKLFCPESMQ
ncbi:hypothetical protein BDW74DRAFT_28055 [Aspergillus multicolor]|uniref:uncharacterized protein n=1 Tax=Aspergillus multicolor TaxID=41759 RepID=UPI003CCCED91